MNLINSSHIEISKTPLEDLLYKYSEQEKKYFFQRYKSKGFHKIIFITKYFHKDLENLSIQCLQNKMYVFIIFDYTIQKDIQKLNKYFTENEKNLIILSKQCNDLKSLITQYFNFDPIRDEFFTYKKDIQSNIFINDKESPTEILNKNFNTEEVIQNPIEKVNNIDNSKIHKKESNIIDLELNNNDYKIIPESNNQKELLLDKSMEKNKNLYQKTHTEEEKENKKDKNLIMLNNDTTISQNLIESKSIAKEEIQYKKPIFSIRAKLLTITIFLITFSLSIMIFAASYFFKRDIETQIQTNNINLVNIISQKVEDSIKQLYFDSDLIIKTMDIQNQTIINLDFFENDILFGICTVKYESDQFDIKKWYLNDILLQKNGITVFELEKIIPQYKDKIQISLTGIFHIINISPTFNYPILLLTAPLSNYPNHLILIFLNGNKLIQDFPYQENAKTFMVNRDGDVLIYPEIDFVLSSVNLKNMPIINMMLNSKLDNGLTNFEYNGTAYMGVYRKISSGGIGIVSITEAKKAMEPVFTTQRRNIYILIIVLIITIIIIYFFSQSLSRPIKELSIATEKVEQEDYSVRVIPRTRDEVGILANSFNKMVKGLEERERMKHAFGRFVNKEIAEKALRGEIKLGGEKKECAIFFSDLRGFTAMSEKMKSEEVVEYLNRYFTLMVDIIEKTHGTVDKFIGDAIMATWGSVTSYGNNTENAVNAALQMRKVLIEFNKYNKEHNLPLAKFGCGINTGEVISGQIGSEKRLEFTVIGDAVNLASRIEGLNKPFATDILISEDSYHKVKDIFNTVKMPAIKVKGKSKPQHVYCVLSRKEDPDSPKNLEELRKLVGIDWKPQIKEDQEILDENLTSEEKYEIIEK